jgi:hypothetical protein
LLFTFTNDHSLDYGDITDKATHAVLLMHKDSRIALCNILKLIHHFIQYTSTNNYHLDNLPESQALLQRYTLTLQNDQVITIKDTIDFLNALNAVEPKTTTTGKSTKKTMNIKMDTHSFIK